MSATAAPAATTSCGRRRTPKPADVFKVNREKAAAGWRVWHVSPSDDPPALRAPYGEAPLVTGRTVDAECCMYADHQPPESDGR